MVVREEGGEMPGSVVLIHAPVDPDSTTKVPAPLGPLYLGAVLKAHDIPVSYFDFLHETTSWSTLEAVVDASDPCLVGFSCNTNNLYRTLHLSDRLLKRFPHATVVLGGPHVTHVWEPYLTDRRVVIRDEGEYPLLRLAQCVLLGQGSLSTVPGLAFSANGGLHVNPISLGPYEEIDAIPFPDYSLLPEKDLYIPAILASRGCGRRCYFCSEPGLNRPYRARSAENVEQELRALNGYYDNRLRFLAINDDTFGATPERVYEICDVLDRVFPDKARFNFSCETRADVLAEHPELVKRLKDSGMAALQIGVESGNQDLLDQMNKQIRREQTEAVVACCDEAGVPVISGNFIFGLPKQTREDLEEEIAFAKRLVDLAPERMLLVVKPLMLYPGSEYQKNAAKWGLSVLDKDLVSGRLADGCFAETEFLSREDIEELCARFRSEVGDYIIERGAPRLTPRKSKELVVAAAEIEQRGYILSRLCAFSHIARIVLLRRREDHRFLFEVPDEQEPECAPVAAVENAVGRSNGAFWINKGSPLEFELDAGDMKYYRYFVGKLTFEEIAQRISAAEGIPEGEAYENCLEVYRECEDSLAAIAVV
jgi:radical SAM superfamily enzyme YgiQ (UPF0313 family)